MGQASLDTQSDEQLMAKLTSGDATAASARAALAVLVERHHGALIGYLYRMVGGDKALAEDLTQEAFMRVIKHSSYDTYTGRHSGYRAGMPFKPWLYAIATNLARDHFKSGATRRNVPPDGLLDLPDQTPGPEDRALLAESRNEVARAVGQLPVEYRATLLLRFYGGMSLQQIAEALSVPVGTVKSRLSTGCRRLRALLVGEHGEHSGDSGGNGSVSGGSEVRR